MVRGWEQAQGPAVMQRDPCSLPQLQRQAGAALQGTMRATLGPGGALLLSHTAEALRGDPSCLQQHTRCLLLYLAPSPSPSDCQGGLQRASEEQGLEKAEQEPDVGSSGTSLPSARCIDSTSLLPPCYLLLSATSCWLLPLFSPLPIYVCISSSIY